jgi:hypothetical protein
MTRKHRKKQKEEVPSRSAALGRRWRESLEQRGCSPPVAVPARVITKVER